MKRVILALTIIFVQVILGQTKYDVVFKNENVIQLDKNEVKPNQNIGVIRR